MQTVSGTFTAAASAAVNQVTFSVLVSWLKTYSAAANFFTINTSAIGGNDFIKGAGSVATFFDKYNYIVETENVNTITVDRTASQIPVGTMSAQADVELDNTSKRYLPDYDPTIGAYIKPGRPIKVNAGFNNETVQLFVGYTDRPKSSLVVRRLAMHATDAMDYLYKFESSLGVQVNKTTDYIITQLLNEAGFNSSQYVIESSLQNPIGFVSPYGQKTGDLIRLLSQAEGAISFFDEQGIFRFWNRLHFDLNSVAGESFNYANLTDVQFIDTPVINDVRVTGMPRAVMSNQLVFKLASPFAVQPGQTYSYIGNFTDENSDLPVTAYDPLVYIDSKTTSFYSTNTASDGSGSPSAGNISVTYTALLGTSFRADFANSSTSTIMYVTDLQLYGTPAKVQTIIEQEYKDQSSIDDNGINPDNQGQVVILDNDYIQDSSTALAYGYNVVTSFSQPRRQFTISPFPNPARQFGDVMNITIEDTGVTYKCVNFGMKTSLSNSQIIGQTLTAEARVFRNYFKINTSSIGGLDAIAP